jgi:hypothetical protein
LKPLFCCTIALLQVNEKPRDFARIALDEFFDMVNLRLILTYHLLSVEDSLILGAERTHLFFNDMD